MTFSEKMNEYIELIGCSAKELSDASLISPAVISRYRNGERIPKYPSEQFNALVAGIYILSKDKNIDLKQDVIKEDLLETLGVSDIDFETFRENFNVLISTLNINVAELARYIGYDSSYLSKIRSGSRKPQNIGDFISAICKYVSINYSDSTNTQKISYMIDENSSTLNNEELINSLSHWLSKVDAIEYSSPTESFLSKLDEFDLNEYIKAIHFDTLKVPTIPVSLPKSKSYFGLNGFKDSQIDTIKAIALSKSHNDLYFYSNMSMVEASKDMDFTKKFMFGLEKKKKKGIQINIIHNLDRPFKELMLGLEGWLPLYMTGLITPHYLKNNANDLFSHLTCTNGNVSLNGYYATGNINNAVFYMTNKKEEISNYVENTKTVWKKSMPLMDIYNAERKADFAKLFEKYKEIKEDRLNIFATLPFYTMSEKLLDKILKRNNIDEIDKNMISSHLKEEKGRIISLLKDCSFNDEITIVSKDEFEKAPVSLSLSYIFYDKKIQYSYEEYLEHIEDIKRFAKENANYTFKESNRSPFKNINLSIINDKCVIISKENAPSIHFVIYHPKLVDAIEKIETPLKD